MLRNPQEVLYISSHFTYSFKGFQQIPDRSVIASYISDTSSVLGPARLAKFKVHGYVGSEYRSAPKHSWLRESFLKRKLRVSAMARVSKLSD
jgi:hypothetical protein